jgi:HK97 gp10 family phage protein
MSGLESLYNKLPAVGGVIEEAANRAIVQCCENIAATARGTVVERSGFLKSSIYVYTRKGSTYGIDAIEPPGDSYMLPEVEAPPPMTGYVAVAANYGWFVEFGTRYMAAQPFLIPSFELETVLLENGELLEDAFVSLGWGI